LDTRQRVTEALNICVAEVFQKDKEYIAEHPELDFSIDLHANSMQYMPLIARLEDEFDIVVDGYAFQKKCRTIEDAINLVTKLCAE